MKMTTIQSNALLVSAGVLVIVLLLVGARQYCLAGSLATALAVIARSFVDQKDGEDND